MGWTNVKVTHFVKYLENSQQRIFWDRTYHWLKRIIENIPLLMQSTETRRTLTGNLRQLHLEHILLQIVGFRLSDLCDQKLFCGSDFSIWLEMLKNAFKVLKGHIDVNIPKCMIHFPSFVNGALVFRFGWFWGMAWASGFKFFQVVRMGCADHGNRVTVTEVMS